MKSKHIIAALFALCGQPVLSADICSDIAGLSEQSGEVELVLPHSDRRGDCKRSVMLSGGEQVHCGWSFPYRATAASRAFDLLIREVAICHGEAGRLTLDQDVNHPDFYDLRTFEFDGQEIGVSLKDKAALEQTYVFLRVTLP